MKILDCGIYREATQEEIDAWGKEIQMLPVPSPTDSDRLTVLEQAIRRGMML